ncbi:MAG: GNAT family N-acetyltransferase [Nocardioidaceae bacterium]|nr:GNAT family N-acetyltransferase [Nocardioidaceae bacterium]
MLIRRMRPADVAVAERVSAEAFLALAPAPSETGPPSRRSDVRAERWRRRAAHLLRHDAEGCWVAEDDAVVGIALALRREGMWGLSAYGVLPGLQGSGIGKALLEAAIGYGTGCLRGMICSSHDPRAARRYRAAGFTLHPAMELSGLVDRSVLPLVDGVREGSSADLDLCDSVDRQVRGAGHTPDHEFLMEFSELLVCDQLTGSGYCHVVDGSPALLSATSRRVASRLLWEALARSAPAASVSFGDVTAEQEWAVDVALAAGLSVYNEGYLCLRHMRPPTPYLPSAHFM